MFTVACQLSVPAPRTIKKEGWVFVESAFWDEANYGCHVTGPCGETYVFLPDNVGEKESRYMCGHEVVAQRVDKNQLKIKVL